MSSTARIRASFLGSVVLGGLRVVDTRGVFEEEGKFFANNSCARVFFSEGSVGGGILGQEWSVG